MFAAKKNPGANASQREERMEGQIHRDRISNKDGCQMILLDNIKELSSFIKKSGKMEVPHSTQRQDPEQNGMDQVVRGFWLQVNRTLSCLIHRLQTCGITGENRQ